MCWIGRIPVAVSCAAAAAAGRSAALMTRSVHVWVVRRARGGIEERTYAVGHSRKVDVGMVSGGEKREVVLEA